MLSLRSLPRLPITPTRGSCHLLLVTCPSVTQKSRGIHDVSLPVCSEETVYTRSAHAFSRAQAQARMEIAELRRAFAERNATIKEKDATIRDLKINLAQQRDIIQQLEKIAQGVVGQKDKMIAQAIKSRDEIMGDGVLTKGRMVEDRVVRADMMMELLGEMRESRREAYDPL